MVSRGEVTLVCVEGMGDALREIAGADAQVFEASEQEAEDLLVQARDRGAVIAVGGKDVRWLELGADEVVAAGVTATELRQAMTRARARAHWRTTNREVQNPELGGLALMSSAVGHEIRNALASAVLNCASLESMADMPEDSEFSETLSDINEALHNITDVVNQMLSLTQPAETAEACDVANALVELSTYLHKELVRVADFEAEVPDEPCPVGLTRARALEVVAALLNNAALAVEKVESREPCIKLRCSREGDMIVVEVSDNGVGMSPEVRKQAMNPFFTTRRPGALGMGLTYAATTVRRAGGEVLIDSEVGAGTTVRLFLPRLRDTDDSALRLVN